MALLSTSFCLLLLASAITSTTTVASFAGRMRIRDTQCATTGFQSCPAGLPGNFCCSQGTSCIPLAGNTTALCCPAGQTCEKIQPITCDINQQNPDQNGSSPIKTSIFNVELEACGTNLCCPFGYSCSGGNQCQKNQDQSESPVSSSSASSASSNTSPAATTTLGLQEATSLIASSVKATGSATAEASSSGSSNHKTASIVGGVIGGCAALALLGVLAFMFIQRKRNRRRRQGSYPEKPSFKNVSAGPRSNVISDPILQPNSYRADFILRSPSISSSVSQRPPQVVLNRSDPPLRLSIPNPFDSPNPSAHSPTHSRTSLNSEDERNAHTGTVGARLAPIRAMKASSRRVSPQNVQREPSSENITIFADPATMANRVDKRQTHATTFTDLMIEANLGDVRHGEPYVLETIPRI